MGEQRWTITVDLSGEARTVGDSTDTVPSSMGWRAVQVVPAAVVVRLTETLKKYGSHHPDCEEYNTLTERTCSCGFNWAFHAALAEYEGSGTGG